MFYNIIPNKTRIEFIPTANHPEVYMNPRPPLIFLTFPLQTSTHGLNNVILFICPAPVINLKPSSLTDVLSLAHTPDIRGAARMPGIPEAEPERGPSFKGGSCSPHTSFSLLECKSITSAVFPFLNKRAKCVIMHFESWYMKRSTQLGLTFTII